MPEPLRYDFLVVGGGLAGLSLALELTHRGRLVACVEGQAPGFGCSSASLGLVYPINPRTVPLELAALSLEAWRDFPQAIRTTEQASGEAARFQCRRLLELSGAGPAQATLSAYAQIGYLPEFIEKSTVSALLPQLRTPSSAIVYDDVWHLDANHYLSLQLRAFLSLGGAWHCPWEARELSFERGECIGVKGTDAELRASCTVLATGASTDLYQMEALTPVRGQSLVVRCRTPLAPFIYTDTLDIVERLDGALHVGSTVEEGCAERCTTFEAVDALAESLHATLALDFDRTPLQTLTGIRSKAKDNAAIVGPTSTTGLFVFTGLFRNGVVFAQLFARMLANHLLNGTDIPPWLSPQRFLHGRV